MGLLTGEKNKKMQSIHPKDKNNDWKDWDWNEEDFPNCHLNEKKEWEWDEQPKKELAKVQPFSSNTNKFSAYEQNNTV